MYLPRTSLSLLQPPDAALAERSSRATCGSRSRSSSSDLGQRSLSSSELRCEPLRKCTSVSMIEAHYGALLDTAHESMLERLEVATGGV